MRLLRLIAFTFFFATPARAEIIWIDTDVSIGSPIREVDDGFALLLAFHSPELQIAGISTTYGNAPLGYTTRVARELADQFGGPAGLNAGKVFAGARSFHDLGQPTAASDKLAAALQKQRLTYIALGPLTDLATFLQLHPQLSHRIDRVIFVGGRGPGSTAGFGPTRSFHFHDANIFKDPAAAAMVVGSRLSLLLVPIETASRLLINDRELHDLRASGPAGFYLSSRSKFWLWFFTHVVRAKGGPIFDALAIMPVIRPELLSVRTRSAKIDPAGNLIVQSGLTNGARRVRCCTNFDPETKSFILGRLRAAAVRR
ncbi:MAG TPA: nucleoside hydrolase [Chthoniobacterales bacterium]|jgi:pyrimidine-specific ribonucleoside hydrolase